MFWGQPLMLKPIIRLALLLALVAQSALAQTSLPPLAQIKIAADAGDPAAQDKMGERDVANAEQWYRKAAEQGYVHAQGKLGELLFLHSQLTLGSKPETRAALGAEALQWSTLAANQGDKRGQAMLARIYLEGKLVKPDLIEAYKWGDLSAQNPTLELIIFAGASSRDAAILKMNAGQISEAQKRVAAFVPHPPRKSDQPAPAWVQQIRLSGISVAAGHRFAIINTKTFAPNDRITLKIGEREVPVQCLEIRESSVVIAIEGVDGTSELKLP